MLQRSRKIGKNTYPLKLPTSVKKAAAELVATDGVSLNQFIAAAVAERQVPCALRMTSCVNARKQPKEGDFVDPLPPVSIRHQSSVRPAAGHDDGFCERSPIFLLADRIHRPQLRQQLVDQRTQPRPRRAVRE